jgi:heme/copper-type cytochrome/quinol oxidase subunit 4
MEPVGPTLFRYGFAFSIGLTLIPVAMISLAKFSLILRAIF